MMDSVMVIAALVVILVALMAMDLVEPLDHQDTIDELEKRLETYSNR